jgi:hypothetical protein
MGTIKKVAFAGILCAAVLISRGNCVTVNIGIDQMVLTYSSSSFANEISSGSFRVGRLVGSEAGLQVANRTGFDAFLSDSEQWLQYGTAVNYRPGSTTATYTFTNHFESFVENYNSTTLNEQPYQLYVAVTSGTDLFGLFTWRGTDGSVSRFPLTADDAPVLTFTNEGFDDGRGNLEAVSGLGSVRMALFDANGDPLVNSAVALIPEPSSASCLVLGSVLLFGASSIRRASKKTIGNKLS